MHTNTIEIFEGCTKILVPDMIIGSMPTNVIFFNPKASINRDFSIIAYSAFLKKFAGPKIFLDGLSGVGTRGLRVANEIKYIQKVIVNDININALKLNARSSILNNLDNYFVYNDDVCRFLSKHSKKHERGSIVDIDPFGSPAKYIDCGIRATMHGGILSVTATDLQVLHGIFKNACKRHYCGYPIKTKYSNEIAIRLILGCIHNVASRLNVKIVPLFVENDYHYYRTYVKIINKPDNEDRIGFILHCKACGNRDVVRINKQVCNICKSDVELAGPLWIDKLFDKEFVKYMLEEDFTYVNNKCNKILKKCFLESELPGTYFTTDEISSRLHVSPLKLDVIVDRLQQKKFLASPTSLNENGFRTNACMHDITHVFLY